MNVLRAAKRGGSGREHDTRNREKMRRDRRRHPQLKTTEVVEAYAIYHVNTTRPITDNAGKRWWVAPLDESIFCVIVCGNVTNGAPSRKRWAGVAKPMNGPTNG